MRAALWLMGLFAAAVALALFTGDNDGTVTIFWPPHRVDLSVNLVLLLLVGLFVLLHLALRALTAALELPRQARRWRAQQRERATHTALLDAMTQYAAGRFLRARKAAEGALAREQALVEAGDAPPHATALRTLAHVTAAESAHALQDHATRDTHLDQALKTAARPGTAAELREGVLLRAARWSLNDRDPAGALARLEELPTGAQRLLALGGDHAVARQWLHPVWDEMLALPESFSSAQRVRLARVLVAGMLATGEASDQEWLARIESAAQANPRDPTLQYLAGMACLHRGLWGRAQMLLAQAARSLQDDGLRRHAWRALAQLAEQRGDEPAAAQAWKRAADAGAG